MRSTKCYQCCFKLFSCRYDYFLDSTREENYLPVEKKDERNMNLKIKGYGRWTLNFKLLTRFYILFILYIHLSQYIKKDESLITSCFMPFLVLYSLFSWCITFVLLVHYLWPHIKKEWKSNQRFYTIACFINENWRNSHFKTIHVYIL